MTDQELLGTARQTLNMARSDWELHGWPTQMVLACYQSSVVPPLHRMRFVERLLLDRLGGGWPNDEARKYAGFRMLRVALLMYPYDAIAIVTQANFYKPTEKFKLRGEAAKKAMETPEQRSRMVAQGLLELVDSFAATVQTPERVCTVVQSVGRGGVFLGEPETHYFPQSSFEGNLKMFGGEVSEEERESVAMFREAWEKMRAQS